MCETKNEDKTTWLNRPTLVKAKTYIYILIYSANIAKLTISNYLFQLLLPKNR